ncbi:hypothetical protein J3Q64DRAFT_1369537 [Phycomyces blakesleeanus]|uniref:Uncharacterized protein n=1 Tax=Phycomyces blakesleeanus TaxID=4837 RepID=A0ABR3AJ18_PHYBL
MLMEVDEPQSLQFKEKLLQGSKAVKVSDLIKRLSDLQTELKALQQETVEKNSLTSVAKDLVTNAILKHENKTVKAITACCLADILRLFAPDAPYSNLELKVPRHRPTKKKLHVHTHTHTYTKENSGRQYNYLIILYNFFFCINICIYPYLYITLSINYTACIRVLCIPTQSSQVEYRSKLPLLLLLARKSFNCEEYYYHC